jgi:hypothetical protein
LIDCSKFSTLIKSKVMSSSLELLAGYGSEDEDGDSNASVDVSPSPCVGDAILTERIPDSTHHDKNKTSNTPAVTLPSFDDAFSGRFVVSHKASTRPVSVSRATSTTSPGIPSAKRPSGDFSAPSFPQKAAKHYASDTAPISSPSVSSTPLAFRPPQLKRPNTVTEDIKMWTSDKKA